MRHYRGELILLETLSLYNQATLGLDGRENAWETGRRLTHGGAFLHRCYLVALIKSVKPGIGAEYIIA